MKRTICLVIRNLQSGRSRLQPWKYLLETARGLASTGHEVTILTHRKTWQPARLSADGMLEYLRPPAAPGAAPGWRGGGPLTAILRQLDPDVVLWHVGLSSFLHHGFSCAARARSVGIFTSPIYTWSELVHAGLFRLAANPSLSAIHLATALVPDVWMRRAVANSGLSCIVTETLTTARALLSRQLWEGPLRTILPGVDDLWNADWGASGQALRTSLGYGADDRVVVFMGSPAPLRGLPVLLKAFRRASTRNGALRLLVLSRGKEAGQTSLRVSQDRDGLVRWVQGTLDPKQLARHVAMADAVVLPFVLLPSDAPLSVLEALALGKPVVTTRIGCLPELADQGVSFLAEPGDVESLADAMTAVAQLGGAAGSARQRRTWQQAGKDWSYLIEGL